MNETVNPDWIQASIKYPKSRKYRSLTYNFSNLWDKSDATKSKNWNVSAPYFPGDGIVHLSVESDNGKKLSILFSQSSLFRLLIEYSKLKSWQDEKNKKNKRHVIKQLIRALENLAISE